MSPLKNVRYRSVDTPKGPVRLAFRGGKGNTGGTVVEAKNLRTGATHTPAEFKADRAKKGKK
jgi:hypothetical protein